jgi:hypothetical protein
MAASYMKMGILPLSKETSLMRAFKFKPSSVFRKYFHEASGRPPEEPADENAEVNLYFDQRLRLINTVPLRVPWEDVHVFTREGIKSSLEKGLWKGWWVHPSVKEGRKEAMSRPRRIQLFLFALQKGEVRDQDILSYL